MDKEAKSGVGLNPGMVAALLVAAGAWLFHETPLEGSRPKVPSPQLEQRYAEQDIDARLWQDPFGAVNRARDAARKADAKQFAADEKRHALDALAQAIQRRGAAAPGSKAAGQPVAVLAVMLPGGPYAESIESRRRTRYAVLAGLNAGGYAPVDTEHLGYALPPARAQGTRPYWPQVLPYEWFEPAPDRLPREGEVRLTPLVLWLDGDAFGVEPLRRLRELADQLSGGWSSDAAQWHLLGPHGSDGLRALLQEVGSERWQHDGAPLRVYSATPTVPDKLLLAAVSAKFKGSLGDYLRPRGVELLRSIGRDDSLVQGLKQELQLRGLSLAPLQPAPTGDDDAFSAYRHSCEGHEGWPVEPPSHIAIVGEWDTLYGRSLRRQFRANLSNDDEGHGFCVERFSYVRGLDGQLPGVGSGDEASGGATAPAAPDDKKDKAGDSRRVERAEGQGQFDYLRRLAAAMRERDRELRLLRPDHRGLRAIGVLGNDLHDKLLVLQALQADFPEAVFFTTDLDARFMHPREQAWTRNLIVASSFGLRLDRRLQSGLPPFRDSYQTSNFFATVLALNDARALRELRDAQARIGLDNPAALARVRTAADHLVTQARLDDWLGRPQIFEIGRTGAFNFGPPPALRGAAPIDPLPMDAPAAGVAFLPVRTQVLPAVWPAPNDARPPAGCRPWQPTACGAVHPAASPMYPALDRLTVAAVLSALLLLAWAPLLALSRGAGRRWRRAVHADAFWGWRAAALVAGLLLLQFALPWTLAGHWDGFAQWLTRDGKPLVFTEGLSMWPTAAIRLFTIVLCLYLLLRGWFVLQRNLDEISAALRLGKTRRRLQVEQRRLDWHLHWWQRLAAMFDLRCVPLPSAKPLHGMGVDATAFWRRYVVLNRSSARFFRTLLCVVVMMLFATLLMHMLGEAPLSPRRGEVSARANVMLVVGAVLAMQFLVFFVADATLLCVRFVGELRHHASWPASTLHHFRHQIELPDAFLDNWIDLQFVARRTRCVGALVYYPFVVLSLLMLSRSSVFDDWHLPLGIAVMFGLSAAVVLGCVVALRRSAEASRRHALAAVEDALLRARGGAAGSAPLGQLELLHSRLQGLREGAFAPFSQQPLLKALLLPFAAFGGTTVLDYLSLVNL